MTGGITRDDAYRVAQDLAQKAWNERIPLRELLEARPELGLDLDTTLRFVGCVLKDKKTNGLKITDYDVTAKLGPKKTLIPKERGEEAHRSRDRPRHDPGHRLQRGG